MKTCFKCNAEHPLSEFYVHPQMGDGHLSKCKRCTRDDVQANRARRREYYKAYDRARSKKVARIKAIRESQKRHPDRHLARVAVHNATTRGKLKKQPCEVCGDLRVDAHHSDYSKPLEVQWLCRIHHMELHRMESVA